MIYVDTSILLARVFNETRSPPDVFWTQSLTSSRLITYETYSRIHARGANASQLANAQLLLGRIGMIDLTQPVLARALMPFPVLVRTLDGLHLATMEFLRNQGQPIELASYDQRLVVAAAALGIPAASI